MPLRGFPGLRLDAVHTRALGDEADRPVCFEPGEGVSHRARRLAPEAFCHRGRAEAVGAAIYALPHSQFCLHKTAHAKFSFVDLTGAYNELGLRSQLVPTAILKRLAGKPLRTLTRLIKPR